MYNKNTKWQIFECGALCESGGGAKETVIWYFVDASVLRLPLLINIKSFVYFFAAAYRKTNWMFDVIWFVVENYAHSEASVINGYAILLTRSYRLHCIFFKYLALSSDFDLLFVPSYTFNFFYFVRLNVLTFRSFQFRPLWASHARAFVSLLSNQNNPVILVRF